ncbi:MAG: peptide ABC transporter substrate-binding protein [Parachlamydiales bacterium]|nr:peptide ABC transporter substrate-binding protein [Parachlamydiales bacterium]
MKNVLRIDFQEGDLTSLHPHDLMIYLRGISIAKILFEGLTRIDEKGEAQLSGASSVNISDLQYTFKLRENHWSDGTPVTAYQYEAAWKEALSPHSSCSRPDLLYLIKNAQAVKKGEMPLDALGVKALDASTLFVELSRPSPGFLHLLAQPICMPLQNPKEKKITGFNGPFLVANWERQSAMRLKPNPHFWNRRAVLLDGIDVFMVENHETAFALYERKLLDWVGVPSCPLSKEQAEHLKKEKKLLSKPIDRAFWVFLNTQNKALSSPSIRKALSLSINREEIANHIFSGSTPLEKPLPHSLLPVEHGVQLKEDLAEAKRLLEEGLNELGLAKLPPIIITYSQQANRKQLAEYLKETWKQNLNIHVQLEAQEWNTLRTNLAKGQFVISGAYEASFYHDPLELMERMISLNSANFPQWVFPLYQEKIALASRETDEKRRIDRLSEAEEILIDQMPFIPICSDIFLFAHHPKLRGYAFDSVGAIDYSYATLQDEI